jgi:hypothetical protein
MEIPSIIQNLFVTVKNKKESLEFVKLALSDYKNEGKIKLILQKMLRLSLR